MTNDDKARKAAEEHVDEYYRSVSPDSLRDALLQCVAFGVAWARANPEWKCPPEYPNEGDVIVIKKFDDNDSWTYHLSRSRRSIPIMSTWILIEALPPAPEVDSK
jgi:hypothetical protein